MKDEIKETELWEDEIRRDKDEIGKANKGMITQRISMQLEKHKIIKVKER